MISQKIETLLKVNELKSFTKAAAALSLTQPAVSQHIKQLEEELNIKIFNRTEKELKLTSEGEITIKYAKRMMILYQNLQEAIKNEKKQIKHLTVGVTHSLENNIISSVFAKYCNEKKDLHITIISDTIKNLYSMLKTYEIDLAFIEGKMIDNDFKSILLDTDCLMIAVSNKNPLAKKTIATLSDLKKEKLLLRLPNSGTRSLFESHLASNNEVLDSFNVILEVDNISTIKELVQNDFGVSILSKSACSLDLKEKRFKLIPVENLSMVREINIFYHHDFEHQGILTDIARIYYEMQKNNM